MNVMIILIFSLIALTIIYEVVCDYTDISYIKFIDKYHDYSYSYTDKIYEAANKKRNIRLKVYYTIFVILFISILTISIIHASKI